MKLSLRLTVIVIPLLVAIAFAYGKRWYDYNYSSEHAIVEHWVSSPDTAFDVWLADWKPYLNQCDFVGGCGCCNAVYEIRGPRRAIETFPLADYEKIHWNPHPQDYQYRISQLK